MAIGIDKDHINCSTFFCKLGQLVPELSVLFQIGQCDCIPCVWIIHALQRFPKYSEKVIHSHGLSGTRSFDLDHPPAPIFSGININSGIMSPGDIYRPTV